jgi:endoglucanase
MRKLLLVTSLFIAGLVFGQFSKPQSVASGVQCTRLGRGVNILGYDNAFWKDHSKGRFKESYFKMIKDAGFTSVRVNLYPFSFMDKDHQIDPAWLKTLDWVVEKGLKADLMVILDLHEFTAMADDPEAKKEMFLSFWRQVAPRYKGSPDNVVFELLNEPNQKLTVDMWNNFLAEAMGIIRQSNPDRTLIIGPGNWNGIES